jgi:predicted nucleic-acid-binding protein
MIGLDTNVLVRFLVQDDEEQSPRATQAIRGAVEEGREIFLSSVVLCELVWVLDVAYRRSRPEIVGALDRIVATRGFMLGDRDAVFRALERYRGGQGDFADHLIGAQAVDAGADRILTFDRALLGFAEFRAP